MRLTAGAVGLCLPRQSHFTRGSINLEAGWGSCCPSGPSCGRFGHRRCGTPQSPLGERPWSGKGGSMKTDNELREEVEEELEWEPSVDERRIGVAVSDGIVTLTGEVRSYAEKWNAERAVERVEGVRGVANDIQVRVVGQRSDTDIAKAAADALAWNSLVPADRVTVRVENGWRTLRGEVDYDYGRRAAERAVRYLDGVRGVSNLISVTPQVEPRTSRTRSSGPSSARPRSTRRTSRCR